MFSLLGFRVYQWMSSQSHWCLYLNVLFDQSMNTGTESDGEKKALKTHRASTLTAHLIQRGLIVIRPGDTAPNRHVELFKLLHFITIVSFLQDKAGIKIQYFLLFLIFLFYLNLHTICSRVTDAKCMERQIYWREWTVSEKLTNTGYDCSALSSSHTSGHKPVNVPQAKIADELSCLAAQFTVIQPHHPHTHTCAQSTPLHLIFARSCELVWASLFLHGIAMGFLAVFTSLCSTSLERPSPGTHSLLWKGRFFCTVSTKC